MSSETPKICERCDTWSDKNGDFAFDHMKYVLTRDMGDGPDTVEYFYAKVYKRISLNAVVDVGTLDLVPIPTEDIWPQCPSSLTRALKSLPEDDYYIKRPSLLDYEAGKHRDAILRLVLDEAEVCEILLNNPHPNIAKYLGCKEVNGKIHGLCFDRYAKTLQERVETGTPLDTDPCLQGIKDGILHLHGLGLTHNDINPRNIMMDANDNPVIIDFDSCRREGEELVKCGTPDWTMEDVQYATRENDFFGLSKLEEYLSKGFKPVEDHVDPHVTSM